MVTDMGTDAGRLEGTGKDGWSLRKLRVKGLGFHSPGLSTATKWVIGTPE